MFLLKKIVIYRLFFCFPQKPRNLHKKEAISYNKNLKLNYENIFRSNHFNVFIKSG